MRTAPLTLLFLLTASLLPGLQAVAQTEEQFYFNDQALRSGIERQGTDLIEAGDIVDYEVLAGQLSERTRYDALPPANFTLTEDGEEIYDTTDDGVLVIARLYLCGRCDNIHANCATGFVVSEDGLAVTNHHVMQTDNAITFVAMTRDGTVHPVIEVLASNEADDITLLRLGGEGFTPLPLARDATVGERVHAITHPNRQFYYYSSGEIARFYLKPTSRGQAPVRRLGITADYAQGSSGGPILNDRGQVVGVVSATRSLYANGTGEGDRNLQMVLHECVPYESILDLFADPEAQ